MNLNEMYVFMEQNSLSDRSRLDILEQLAQEVNSPHYPLAKYLASDKKYVRALLAATMNERSFAQLAKSDVQDEKFPTLFCHCLLIRASNEHLLSQTMQNSLVEIINNHKEIFNSPGTTLGYAVGYLIGKGLFAGQNTNDLIKLCSNKFIIDEDIFVGGIKTGFNGEARGLLFDSFYKKNLTERYEKEWSESSRQLCYQVLQVIATTQYRANYTVNPLNEKMTWFLNGMYPEETLFSQLYKLHGNTERPVKLPVEMVSEPVEHKLTKFL